MADLDEYGLWSLVEEVTSNSGFDFTPDCRHAVMSFVERGNTELHLALEGLGDGDVSGTPREILQGVLPFAAEEGEVPAPFYTNRRQVS